MFNQPDINLSTFRKTLFTVAYKMIGEAATSEDLVQETMTIYLIKKEKKELAKVENIQKYLIKTISNLSLNYLKKIKQKRTSYFGVWLPEPILEETQNIDFQLDIDYGLTFLLNRLNPKERAIFILKNAFDFTFKEIGDTLTLKEATCRKSYQRLKDKIKAPPTKATVQKEAKERLLKAFLSVGQQSGLDHLIALLKEDVILYSDGGGKVSAAKNPLKGKAICVKFLLGLFQKKGDLLQPAYTIVNGEPAIQLNNLSGELDTIIFIELENYQINRLYFIRNPEKLGN